MSRLLFTTRHASFSGPFLEAGVKNDATACSSNNQIRSITVDHLDSLVAVDVTLPFIRLLGGGDIERSDALLSAGVWRFDILVMASSRMFEQCAHGHVVVACLERSSYNLR